MDVRLQQIRKAALADRLNVLAKRGHVMPDEYIDIWQALEILSFECEKAIDLLDLEDVMNSKASSMYLSQVQRVELRLAGRLCLEQAQAAV
jgi:hypothetical protein